MAQRREEEPWSKLLSSLPQSSVWAEPDPVRLVWITMMAMKDKDGYVWASVIGLAHAARESVEDTEDALRRFQSPDPYSRNPANQGRRIEVVPGGWRVLNHTTIRGTRDMDERRRQDRERKRRVRQVSASVRQCPPESAHTDPDPDTDPDKKRTTLSGRARRKGPCEVCEKALVHMNQAIGKNHKLGGEVEKAIHHCHTRASPDPEKALDACVSVIDWLCDGWKGRDMENYLRPSTIFATTKFAQRWEAIQAGEPPPTGKGAKGGLL